MADVTFFPAAAHTLEEAGVDPGLTEHLLIKALYAMNGATSSGLAKRLCLPSQPLRDLLTDLKQRNLVVHRSAAMVTGDFRYDLSDLGRVQAETLMRRSAWSAAAPVGFDEWVRSIHAQSVRHEPVTAARLDEVLVGLELEPAVRRRLGMSLSTGQALFLYGAAGNGKTSVAERLTRVFPTPIFIPHVVDVGGHLIRVFDPLIHVPVPETDVPRGTGRLDPRWVCCQRPTVIAGGELRLEMLELTFNPRLGAAEAPLQVKASGGTLVIDDFGRQLVSPRDLLNRWIVPLERRVDFLSLPDGTKLELPFDPFVVFATNLDPAELVDEAFLRRIPYKVELPDPSREGFVRLFVAQAAALGLTADPAVLDGFITEAWVDRPMRACQPRDLLTQVRDRQRFLEEPPTVSPEALWDVAGNYFVGGA